MLGTFYEGETDKIACERNAGRGTVDRRMLRVSRKMAVDLGYDDDNLQGWWWWVDAYLLTPVPASINYELPNWPQYRDRGNR